jgi:glycosyltransferase involved in cell wall biosynthesis
MVLLEAMAAGLPVIASRVGGVAELVGHGRDGWLVEPGDVMALRAALLEALLDPGARATRGSAARERVAAEFSHERMVSRTLGVYRDVLEA